MRSLMLPGRSSASYVAMLWLPGGLGLTPRVLILVVVLSALLGGVIGCSNPAGTAAESRHPTVSQDSIAWPALGTASSFAQSEAMGVPASGALTQGIAPVSIMLEGLRSRLEDSPDDAKGWALLAQSYVFVGDHEAAAQAHGRAVALGFDEAELRKRMRLASGPQQSSPNWIDQALAPRPK